MIDVIKATFSSSEKIIQENCDRVAQFLDNNPTIFKVVVIASHFFRAASMYALMHLIPTSFITSCAILTAFSLLYRAAIERFCSFRFTLPSLFGSLAMEAARPAAIALSAGRAFSSLSSCFSTGFGITSLAAYVLYVCHLSHLDVERRMGQLNSSCCR